MSAATTYEARPEGALSRWCVVEVSEAGLRLIADDLAKDDAERIADALRCKQGVELRAERRAERMAWIGGSA